MHKYISSLALLSIPFMAVEMTSQAVLAENIKNPETLSVHTVQDLKVQDLKVASVEKVKKNQSLPLTVGDLKTSAKASDLALKSKIGDAQTTSPETLVAQTDKPATTDAASAPSPEPTFGSSFTILPSVGTLGFGLGVATPINGNFQARVGLNYASFGGIDATASSIKYTGTLNLFSATALVDYYPFGLNSWLSITGGLAYQNNRLSGKGVASGIGNSVTVNGVNYPLGPNDSINGTFNYPNNIAPYLGLGFSTQIAGGFGIYSNLGVIFAGTPKSEITTASPSLNSLPGFQANLAEQNRKTQDEVNRKVSSVYPVLTFGLSYQF